MDLQWLVPLGGFLGIVGAGAWKLIDRADKKRERREVKVEELLKTRVANLEAEKEAERKQHEAEVSALRRYSSRIKGAAGKWREQLIANHIDPVPAEWPEEEPSE